jgi:hypothetical protein
LTGLDTHQLIGDLVQTAEAELRSAVPALLPLDQWSQSIRLPSGMFSFEGHEYQRGILLDQSQRTVLKKGSQLGVSEAEILKSLHGMMSARYVAGVLYLFPIDKDVTQFSKARFAPLLRDNPHLAREVKDTDSAELKQIRKAMLYLRGAKATSKIEGQKKMATQLLSIPVDRVVFDERDLMDEAMIDLALERMGHSSIQEEVYLGTPSLPDYGVTKLYDESDHRVWEIKCQHCGTGTILELEFPACILDSANGYYRACKKCKREIFTRDGQWITLNPSNKDLAGFWISRLNSPFVNLKKVMELFASKDPRKKTELYNSVLAMAYVPSENKLNPSDVIAKCGQDLMEMRHPGPCAMGVDVGAKLNVVIGYRKDAYHFQLVHVARVTEFEDLSQFMKSFNVQCCVIDCEPELRKAREFEAEHRGRVWLCDYQDTLKAGPAWDEPKRMVKANRTETCDATHELFNQELILLPHKNEEIVLFSRQASNIAKVLEEDKESGSRTYVYKTLGEDHYRHALNYFWLACKQVSVVEEDTPRLRLLKMLQEAKNEEYDPLTHGLNVRQS